MRDRDLDRKIDEALARYAAVEPREGFEQRVLANLRARQSSARRNLSRLVGTAFAAVVFGTLLFTLIQRRTELTSYRAAGQLNQARDRRVGAGRISPNDAENGRAESRTTQVVAKNTRVRNQHPGASAFSREAGQFPSPQPLSEQEKLLVRYVEVNRQELELTSEVVALMQRDDGSKLNSEDSWQNEW